MQDVERINWVKLTIAAILAIFVGIGLSRFACTPLIPDLVAQDWFTPAQAGYLGAANLGGYLAGALVGQQVAKRWQAKHRADHPSLYPGGVGRLPFLRR
jgi:fucose permease